MRHEYVGDVGDFGKYALLNALAGEDLQLGVVWYLNASTESTNDRLFTDYTHLRSCNPVLHDQLLKIVQSQNRSLEKVEAAALLPGKTIFYREPMPYSERPCFSGAARARETSRRRAWHEDAIGKLSNTELVFLDPDNGLAGTRVKAYGRKASKYAFREPLKNSPIHRRSVCGAYTV